MINKSSFIQSLLSCKNVIAGQSTRLGGKSQPPFSTLNLGLNTDDDPQVIRENRTLFFNSIGIREDRVAGAHQVHGTEILEVNSPGLHEGYDAFITNRKQILLTVTVADCTPILICDPVRNAIAAIHAGWKGTAYKIVQKTLSKMQNRYGTEGKDCFAYIGTCIDECSFEVDADVADEFSEKFKRWDSQKGKFFVDLKLANKQQLLNMGVPEDQIEISPFSTFTHNDRFFSYRKEGGQTGRMLAVIGMPD